MALKFMANIQYMLRNSISVDFIKGQYMYFSFSLNFQFCVFQLLGMLLE